MKLFSLFKRTPKVEPTGYLIDMTRGSRRWGHNISFMSENQGKSARFAIWVTPAPKVGDWMQYETDEGLVTVQINEVEPARNVFDMSFIEVTPVRLDDVQ